MQSSYDLLLQQQQLFLQWQREVEKSRALGTSQDAETINDALVAHGVSYVSDNASLFNISEQ
ncbi:hypothetical protein WUBG_16531, partial [Wuchereria bancrofti]